MCIKNVFVAVSYVLRLFYILSLCLFVCPQTSFNSVFLCRLAAFVVRAMQETQPTRSKAKFQLNQQTVQTDGEPSKRTSEQTNEPSVDCDDDVGKQRECEQRRPNEEQQTEIEIHNTHTHTHDRQSEHAHTQTCWRTRFVSFRALLLLVGGLVAAAAAAADVAATLAALLTVKLHALCCC